MTGSCSRPAIPCTRQRSGSSCSPSSCGRNLATTGLPEPPVNGWGHDPMSDRRQSVDGSHAMTTALRYTQLQELDELLPQRTAGRFGREVRTIACPDPEKTPSRTSEAERIRALMKKS